MPVYEYSNFNLDISVIEIITTTTFPSLPDYLDSYLNIDKSNVEVLIQGPSFSPLEGVIFSSFLFNKTNIEILVQGTSPLFVFPIQSEIRQIYTDDSKIYAATSDGLVVFNL